MNRTTLYCYVIFLLDLIGSNRIAHNLGRGKNALLLLVNEAIGVVNTEIRILNMQIKYPNQFQQRKDKLFTSPLHLTDETNLIEVMEIVSGLFLSKRVVTNNGKPIPLTVLGKAFEELFNTKLGDIHKKHENVISRKPTKITEFLDTLRKAITEESKTKGYL